jgi:hypothetical protein
MFQTKYDLPLLTRTRVVKLLNERLADAIDLGTQSKHAHRRDADQPLHGPLARAAQAAVVPRRAPARQALKV